VSEWQECKLGEVAVFQRGHDLPKTEMNRGSIPVAGSNGIIGYHNEATTKGPGITIGRSGNIGIPKFYECGFWAHNTVLYVKDFKGNDEKFVFYFLHTFDFSGFNAGSAVPTLNRNHIHEIPVIIPPLPEQRAIAGVLSSLDDKIDLLHRQNKTLEGMAESLWRNMFVEEADPRWKKGKLGDYGEFKNGINYSRNENGDTEYSILNVRDIIESKYANVSNFEKVSINSRKATPYLLEKGDIVIVRSASPGESLIVLEEIDNLIYSGFSIRLRCYDRRHSLFLFQFLQSFKKEMDAFSDGTTLRNINQGILNSIELLSPSEDTVKEFNDRVGIIYNKILLNQVQTHTLYRLRDTLIPKLMSGEVKVKI